MFDFAFSPLVVDDVLGLIDGLSQFLQLETLHVFAARNSALAVTETMNKLQTKRFELTWEKAEDLSLELRAVVSSHPLFDMKEAFLPQNAAFPSANDYYKS